MKQWLATLASGLMPHAVLEKRVTMKMLGVYLPSTHGRWLIVPRYTQQL
jgi:hypothetical protein